MASVTQVLLLVTLLSPVYCDPPDSDLGNNIVKSTLQLINPSNLLDLVAQLTYPITTGINNIVGSLTRRNHATPPKQKYSNDAADLDTLLGEGKIDENTIALLRGILTKLAKNSGELSGASSGDHDVNDYGHDDYPPLPPAA